MAGLLEGKVCIVTGSARGIGRAVARLFAAEGAQVAVNGTHPGSAEEWIAASGHAGRLHPYYFDVSDPDAVRRNVRRIADELGRIDVLVNNAGVEENSAIGMIERSAVERMLRVNVCGVIEMIQAVSRIMARGGGGSIINISSVTALRGNPGQLAYSASKGAVIALTRTAAKELAPKGIRVNSIAPGLTKTDMLDGTDPEKLRERIARIGLGRIASPEDIAGACLLLATDWAGYISGQVLAVDGCTSM